MQVCCFVMAASADPASVSKPKSAEVRLVAGFSMLCLL
jgi:hypothetical protein